MEDYKVNEIFPKVFEPISYGKGLPGADEFKDHNHDGINSKLLDFNDLLNAPASGPKTATFVIGPSSNSDSDTYDYVTDGTADDVEIQAAIDALPSIGGRIIFREGTYTLAAVVTIAKDGVTLQGQGKSSIITIVNAASNVSMFKLGHSSTTYKNCVIRDFYLDGNTASVTGTSYIIDHATLLVPIQNVWITGCYITNAETAAIVSNNQIFITENEFVNNNGSHLTGSGDFVIYLDTGNNAVVVDSNYFSEDTRTSIGFIGPASPKAKVNNNFFKTTSNVNVSLIKAMGFVTNNSFFQLSGTLGASFIGIEECSQVIGNRFADGGATFNIASTAIKDSQYIANNLLSSGVGIRTTNTVSWIMGNEIFADGDAIQVNDSRCVIIGNDIRPGDAAADTYNAITVNGAFPCIIQGNIIRRNTGNRRYQYGVRETGTGVGPSIITGNYMTGALTFISTQNPSTEVSHNITV